MAEIINIPLDQIAPLNDGKTIQQAGAVVIVTPAAQWAYGAQAEFAQAEFESVGNDHAPKIVRVRLNVYSGALGVGWLQEDGKDWVIRTSASMPTTEEVALVIPAEKVGGRLVFDNWTEGGRPAVGIVHEISVMDMPEARDAQEFFHLACAEEERGSTELAISYYKAALRLDPSHVELIAGLGRLRFVDPGQPFMAEMRRRAPLDVSEVHIQIRNPCNYRCFYCVAAGSNNIPVQRLDLDRIVEVYANVKSKLIVTSFECGGGEPTIHPQFPELLRICADHGAVSFPSNNSQDPKRWLATETARRISLRAALHPEGEIKINQYLEYAQYLVEAGVNFVTQYIAHPNRLPKIPQYLEIFRARGIPFSPIAFIGEYEGKPYPYSYSDEQKELLRLNVETTYWAAKIGPHTNRIRNFRGIPCIAGARQIYVMSDGSLRRCMYDFQRILERPLEQPEPCGVGNCGCGMFLEKLNFTENIEFYNYFGAHVGVEPLPTDWMNEFAKDLGYAGPDEAMASEGIKMYDALMGAYGKEEFPESSDSATSP